MVEFWSFAVSPTQYIKNMKQTFGCVASEFEYEQCPSFSRFLAGIQSASLQVR
jgi:hypothetical protein